MKKLFIVTLIILLLGNNVMVVNAAHQHSDSCYTMQGAHTHTGSVASGGGCYTKVNYHVHSGDEINGGQCYGAPIYHIHSGQAGQSTANGCYTLLSTTTKTCNVTSTSPVAGAQETRVCKKCNVENVCTHYAWGISHSSCGLPYSNSSHGYITCNTCGTVVYSWGSGATNPVETYFQPKSHEYKVTVYDLGCGKTEQTIEYYQLSCGKTTETIESYSLSCGITESAGSKVLTCTIPESVDAPVSEPITEPIPQPEPETTPTAKPNKEDNNKETISEETIPEETIPEETVEDIQIKIDPSDYDIDVDYKFTDEGVVITITPTNLLAMAENPYSWDNKITWSKNTECVFSQTGTYYISAKNINNDVKTKILTVDFERKTVTIEEEHTALAAPSEHKPVSIPFKTIGIVVMVLIAIVALACLVCMLVLRMGAAAQVLDEGMDEEIGAIKIKKQGNGFVTSISDKILLKKSTSLVLVPDKKLLSNYIGYSLTIKSSSGVVETEISSRIAVEF